MFYILVVPNAYIYIVGYIVYIMVTIQFKCDPDLYFKMKRKKAEVEEEYGNAMSWEHFVGELFGFYDMNKP